MQNPPGHDSFTEEATERYLFGKGGLHDRVEQHRDDADDTFPGETRGGDLADRDCSSAVDTTPIATHARMAKPSSDLLPLRIGLRAIRRGKTERVARGERPYEREARESDRAGRKHWSLTIAVTSKPPVPSSRRCEGG